MILFKNETKAVDLKQDQFQQDIYMTVQKISQETAEAFKLLNRKKLPGGDDDVERKVKEVS